MSDPNLINGGVPAFITKKMKAALHARGYSADDLLNMEPLQAHRILGNGATPSAATPAAAASNSAAPATPTPAAGNGAAASAPAAAPAAVAPAAAPAAAAPTAAPAAGKGKQAPAGRPAFKAFKVPKFVPEELKKRRRWIGYQAVWDPVREKWDKKPICIPTGDGFGFLTEKMHVNYDEAVAGVKRLKLDGLGYVMMAGDGLTGGDIDKGRDPITGAIDAHIQEIIDWRETYFEISPSGRGVRFFGLEELPKTIKDGPTGIELYSNGRFLTFTGDTIGAPSEVKAATRTVEKLTAMVKAAKAERAAHAPPEDEDEGVEAFKRGAYRATLFGRINTAALDRLEEWVPLIFPTAEYQPGTGAWRVKSEDVCRPDLEEDLSIHPTGGVDFGVHDQDDPRGGGRSPVDIVLKYCPMLEDKTPKGAALWLADELGLPEKAALERMGAGDNGADRWAQLYEALQWPGKARIRRKENITRRFRGVASFGKDAMPGNASERAWITNRHIRGVVSEMNGMPGGGKSGLAVAYANAIAAEKPELAGLSKIERCGTVVIIAADGERAEEFKRKDEAFRALHGLTNADYRHSLHVVEDTGSFTEKVGAIWVPSRWIIALAGFLAELREKEKLATVSVDTLLGVSGSGNTAEAIDMQPLLEVVKLMISELDCSVEILNHFTKGGAKDPASMDAGLGARPMTATPRFVTNLTSAAGGLVKVEAPKASYLGGPTGASIFEWKSVPIPVNVFDVDGAFTGTRTEEIGVLVPSTQLALRQMKEDAAYEALRKAAASGMKIIRTKPGGRAEPDHASAIIKEAVDLKTTAEVEAMIETLIRQGRITQTTVKRDPVRKRQVEAITVNEPEPDPI